MLKKSIVLLAVYFSLLFTNVIFYLIVTVGSSGGGIIISLLVLGFALSLLGFMFFRYFEPASNGVAIFHGSDVKKTLMDYIILIYSFIQSVVLLLINAPSIIWYNFTSSIGFRILQVIFYGPFSYYGNMSTIGASYNDNGLAGSKLKCNTHTYPVGRGLAHGKWIQTVDGR